MKTNAGTVHNIDTSELILEWSRYARTAKRRHRRSSLKRVLDSKDKKFIWNYCYQKATLKDMSKIMEDLIVYGRAYNELDEKKVVQVLIRTQRWAARLNKISGVSE